MISEKNCMYVIDSRFPQFKKSNAWKDHIRFFSGKPKGLSLEVAAFCDFIVDEVLNKESALCEAKRELATKLPTKGKFHLEKSENYLKRLERWLKNNPAATSGDRAAAENIILDLKDAIQASQWYSKTVIPK